jgi:carotenoid cleavage dioxygenase
MEANRRQFLTRSSLATLLLTSGKCLPLVAAEDDTNPAGDAESPSPFLLGNFAPVHEEISVERLEVVGRLPAGLSGMYVRTGPNPQFPPRGRYHWFDGDGMLHGVLLREGAASYRNRWVRTDGFKKERAAGKALWTGLAEPPDMAKMLAGEPLFKNAGNTALVWHDRRLLTLWEGGAPHEMHVPDLETVGPVNYDGRLRHPFTAHPKVDAETGEMMLFGYSAMAPVVHYSLVNAAGELTNTVPVKLRRSVMMHDFAVTARHSIFMELPATFNMGRMSRGEPLLKYEPDLGSRFGILPRHGRATDIRWFEAPACFVFHTLNAWDDGDEVVLVACRLSEYPEIVGTAPVKRPASSSPHAMPIDTPSSLYQWRFNLATGEVREQPLDDLRSDFPRVNDRRLGRQTRFGYTMALDMHALLKYDLERGTSVRHDFGPGRYAGEGVFVAAPDAQQEDDGWLVTYVFDAADEKSELVVIDAREFSSAPVARVRIPARVPFGFHGIWLGDEQLSEQRA